MFVQSIYTEPAENHVKSWRQSIYIYSTQEYIQQQEYKMLFQYIYMA